MRVNLYNSFNKKIPFVIVFIIIITNVKWTIKEELSRTKISITRQIFVDTELMTVSQKQKPKQRTGKKKCQKEKKKIYNKPVIKMPEFHGINKGRILGIYSSMIHAWKKVGEGNGI